MTEPATDKDKLLEQLMARLAAMEAEAGERKRKDEDEERRRNPPPKPPANPSPARGRVVDYVLSDHFHNAGQIRTAVIIGVRDKDVCELEVKLLAADSRSAGMGAPQFHDPHRPPHAFAIVQHRVPVVSTQEVAGHDPDGKEPGTWSWPAFTRASK